MRIDRTASPYSPVARGLHWLVVALITIQFITAYTMPHIGRKTAPSTIIDLHFSFGVLILLVMAVRFVHRLLHPVPLEKDPARPWEHMLAHLTHLLIYFILLVSPFLGWAAANAHNLPVTLFGIFTLPSIAEGGAEWGHTAGDIHGTAMWVLLWLIGLHVAAALYHHVLRKDGTLRRMLPSLGR